MSPSRVWKLQKLWNNTIVKFFVLILAMVCCNRLRTSCAALKQCKETAGTFDFLVKRSPTAGCCIFAHEYDKVKINCSTTVCNATVTLMVGAERVSLSESFNDSLTRVGDSFSFIAQFMQDDTRLWCRAKARGKVITSEWGTLMIRAGRRSEPVTLVPDITELTLEKGDSFPVICKAPGHGTQGISYIKWYKENATGKYSLGSSMVVRKSNHIEDIEVLTIRNATSGVQGIYICERNVLNGPITSASIDVIYKEPVKPSVTISSTVLKVREHQGPISLVCIASFGSPKPSFSWYKDGLRRKACFKQMNCTYLIQYPRYPEDDGNFTCTASNTEGDQSRSMNVLIMVRPVVAKTDITDEEYAMIADAGKNAELKCTVKRGNPLPNFTWHRLIGNTWRDDFEKVRVVPNMTLPSNTSTLVIPPSTGAAFYRCWASNEAGDDARNITVRWKGGTGSNVSSSKRETALVIVISCSMVLIALILLLTYVYKRRLFKKYGLYLQPNLHFQFNSNLSLQDQVHRMPYDPKWEFPKDKLIMLEPIGKGAFGEVWLAKAQGILDFKAQVSSMSPIKKKRFSRMFSNLSGYDNADLLKNAELSKVAVKTLKDDATDIEFKDLASELKILIHIGEHQNIVNLLGACTQTGKLCVILEYCLYGDLSSFLRGKRDIFEPSWTSKEDGLNCVCTYLDLVNFTYQIARGMDFLSSKKCVHRDLAARNVLVSKDHNDAFVVKVADFGMSRDIYRDGIYVKQSSGVLPLKWTSPESIADAIYTSQSDVWSYGVVLWEIFTLGGSPYPGVSTDEFIGFLKSKKKMEQPETCPDEFYKLMLDCWEDEPDMRPIFAKIYNRIGDIIEEFADVNSAYLRLESIGSSKQKDTDGYINSPTDTDKGIESTETVVTSLRSCETSTGSKDKTYENLMRFEQAKGNDLGQEPPMEYVEMVDASQSDVNENLLQSERMHPLL